LTRRIRRVLVWTLAAASLAGAASLIRSAGAQAPAPRPTPAGAPAVILATTTSTQDSGLLDVLVPRFERETGYLVKPIAVGTGQALALAAKGEADVALVHAPALEKRYVGEGTLRNRRLVMYNDFVIVGPAADPAQVKGLSAVEALRSLAERQARFVSRGDGSGTHLLEQALWRAAAVQPAGSWYIESGQGMGLTLQIAGDRRAYVLTDRGTYLAFQKRVELVVLVERDRPLLNLYAVLEVNPANGPRVNAVGGKAFADFMVALATQAVIRTFGVDTYGQPLFVPWAGRREEELGQ
jgi:tungstate transport system substrate-binding protein